MFQLSNQFWAILFTTLIPFTSALADCRSAGEYHTSRPTCPSGTIISSISMASYGNPLNACPNYKVGSCHFPNSLNVVKSRCLGKNNCSIPVTDSTFGQDLCPKITKRFVMLYSCSKASPSPTPTATPRPTVAPTATPRPTVAPTATPRPTVAPTATPRPTVAPTATPIPTASPSGAYTVVRQFNFAQSAPLLDAQNQMWVPSPWIVDFSGPRSVRVNSNFTQLYTTIKDGYRWVPLYNYSGGVNYARSEIASSGSKVFPTNVATAIEWKGFFPQELPPYTSGQNRVTAIFQLHNDNGGSPMFALGLDVAKKKIQLHRHSKDNAALTPVDIADYSTFVNQSHTIRMTIVPSSTSGTLKVEIDGKLIVSYSGIPTSSTPGMDYVKFGLYDWGRVLVDPGQPARGRIFEMVTEDFRIIRPQ
jgi:hypothetical protein